MSTNEELAAVLHAALETGLADELVARFTSDGVGWHNNDRLELDRDAAIARIAGAHQVADGLRVEVVASHPTSTGFVEQIVLRGKVRSSGRPLELHNCLVVRTSGDRIVRIDEYVDPTAAAQIAAS